MGTKQRISDGLFRAKLLTGSIILGAFLGVTTYIFWLSGWAGMDLIQLARGGLYVYQRAPGMLGLAAFGGAFGLGWIAWMFAWRPGAARPGDADDDADNLRGQQLVTVAEIKKQIRSAKTKTRLEIGGVPIPIYVEDGGFLLTGSPGTGKSQATTKMLDTLQAGGHRAVIADAEGIFYSRYAGDGAVLFNPLDRRSVSWSPLAELKSPQDCSALAKSLIPDGHGAEASWNDAAQTVLEGLLRRCWETSKTNAELYRLACVADIEELQQLLAGTAAMTVVGNARYFGEVRPGLGRYLRCFEHLDPAAGRASFSVRDFITEETGWLFISYTQEQRAALLPLIQCTLDVASRAILSLPHTTGDRSKLRRTWLVLDELPLLGRIMSLIPLLTNGSKHGAAVIATAQTIALFREAYGHDATQTILATLGTWLTLRVSDAETAEYMSKSLGDEEVRRVVASGGKNDSGKSDNWSEQHSTRRVVMPSQLQNLPRLHGYLNISGPLPVCAVTLPYADEREPAAPAYEPAPLRSAVPVPVSAAVTSEADPSTVEGDGNTTDTTADSADVPFTLER
ncbi:putative type IV secretory pathway VirD4 component [Thiobacillus denitrificans ATCC 25259]|uniref:Putative type IV secretory pathway VirD4 component n=1 Tax=Thiobacillus denitrificans (strain ATCC 25259 / T1) TaxID=292415 RepID=Q3SHV9_THIDA|nr:type IV secretion system DNA-binding domain-containing protein [Thiobacillus denitrificans]AAZ97774.1 putative type IV secretory pathway VirD4 component [Thiobacillus denitrificans ATCC 25259]